MSDLKVEFTKDDLAQNFFKFNYNKMIAKLSGSKSKYTIEMFQ